MEHILTIRSDRKLDLQRTIGGLEERNREGRKLVEESTRIAAAALASPDREEVKQLKLELADVQERRAKLDRAEGYALNEPGRIRLADVFGRRVQVDETEPEIDLGENNYMAPHKLRKLVQGA